MQTNAEEDLFTAETQRAQRINFLFVGRRRQTKTFLKLELKVFAQSSFPDWAKGLPQRTQRLCGEMSESLSARIGENLRLITLCGLGVLARKSLRKTYC